MIVYICDSCGAEVKNEKPKKCPLCKKTEFKKYEREEPSENNLKESQIFEMHVKKMEEKDKGDWSKGHFLS